MAALDQAPVVGGRIASNGRFDVHATSESHPSQALILVSVVDCNVSNRKLVTECLLNLSLVGSVDWSAKCQPTPKRSSVLGALVRSVLQRRVCRRRSAPPPRRSIGSLKAGLSSRCHHGRPVRLHQAVLSPRLSSSWRNESALSISGNWRHNAVGLENEIRTKLTAEQHPKD